MAYSLDCYGYKDASTPLVSAKQQQKAIDASQDEKIKELEASEGGGGKTPKETLVETTYLELVGLRDGGKLIPGWHYRITDYETKIPESNYMRAVDHKFDIIVLATSNNTISNKAHAVQHDGEDYFNGCNLSAWELEYTLDNDKFFPNDGTFITFYDYGDVWRAKEIGEIELESGTYISSNLYDDGNDFAVTLKNSGTTRILSGGTFATLIDVDEDFVVLCEQVGTATTTNGLSFATCMAWDNNEFVDLNLKQIGSGNIESGGTFGVFDVDFFGEKVCMLCQKSNETQTINDTICGVVSVSGQGGLSIPMTYVDSINISGTTYFLWYVLNSASAGKLPVVVAISDGNEVGSNVYTDGVSTTIDEFLEDIEDKIDTIINKGYVGNIREVYEIDGGTFSSWNFDPSGLFQFLTNDNSAQNDTYVSLLGYFYIPASMIASETIQDGDGYVLYENIDSTHWAIQYISFKNTQGSILYNLGYDGEINTSEFGILNDIETNIQPGSVCTVWYMPDYDEYCASIDDSHMLGVDSYNQEEDSVELISDSIKKIEAIETINDNQICNVFVETSVYSDGIYFATSTNSGTPIYLCDDNYESGTSISHCVGFVGDSIEIEPGTYYKLFDFDDGVHVVSKTGEVGDYVYYIYNGLDLSNPLEILSREVLHSGGKGVISRMTDDFNNSLPYDFKNIQFKRWKITSSQSQFNNIYLGVLGYLPSESTVSIPDENDFNWCYTFDKNYNKSTNSYDTSLPAADGSACSNNYVCDCGDGYLIPNNVFFGYTTNNNKISFNSYANTIFNVYYIIQYNVIGVNCVSNIFGGSNNIIGNDFFGNLIGRNFDNNVILNGTRNVKIGNGCYGNTICNYCSGITITEGSSYNTIGSNCKGITFLKKYIEDVTVEDGNQYVEITSTKTTSASNKLRNFTVAKGVNNTNTTKTISHDSVNDNFKTTYESSGSTIVNV